MKIHSAEFIKSAFEQAHWTTDGLPEISFLGRSNVGKSSLINSMLGRKGLARTSNTPGRTQSINFFLINEKFYFVDLPGYGYAKVSKSAVDAWTQLIEDYLRGRPSLRRTLLLIDARVGIKESDEAALTVLDEAAVATRVVLTKIDKAKAGELADHAAGVEAHLKAHAAAFPQATPTSAHTGAGMAELRADIAELLVA